MEKHTRSIGIFVLSWPLSGTRTIAGSFASTEALTKSVFYNLHGRAWTRVGWGRYVRTANPCQPIMVTKATSGARRWLPRRAS